MFIFAKSIKGKEFMYSKTYSVLCKSKKQAQQIADFMNLHNDTATKNWKLKDNEIWWVYKIDKYDNVPLYKIKQTQGKIVIVENNNI